MIPACCGPMPCLTPPKGNRHCASKRWPSLTPAGSSSWKQPGPSVTVTDECRWSPACPLPTVEPVDTPPHYACGDGGHLSGALRHPIAGGAVATAGGGDDRLSSRLAARPIRSLALRCAEPVDWRRLNPRQPAVDRPATGPQRQPGFRAAPSSALAHAGHAPRRLCHRFCLSARPLRLAAATRLASSDRV